MHENLRHDSKKEATHLDQNTIYTPSSGFVMRQIAGEILLIPVGEQTKKLNGMVTFSETGAFIWNHLDGKNTAADVAWLLADECGEDIARVQPDVMDFLDRAFKRGLLNIK